MKAKKENIKETIQFMARKDGPYRNCKNTDFLTENSEFVYNQFKEFGYKPSYQKYKVTFDTEIRKNISLLNDLTFSEEEIKEIEKYDFRNIIASYNPEAKKRLIIGAHYDVHGDMPGADDNASAVAGLLETARIFYETQPEIDYGIDFVSYCLEEWPFYNTKYMGSMVYAKSLADHNVDVIGLINYEMIGYFTEGRQDFPPIPGLDLENRFPAKGNFLVVAGIPEYKDFNKKVFELMKKSSKVPVYMIDDDNPYVRELAGLSDQWSFWQHGLPGVMITDTSFLRNPNYHQHTDTIDTLDLEKNAQTVDGVAYAAMNFDY